MDSTCVSLQPKPQISGLAIASLVLSCLTVFLGPFGCLPGVVCGHLARRQIRKAPNTYYGNGVALAGLIVGYTFLVIMVIMVLFVFLPIVCERHL